MAYSPIVRTLRDGALVIKDGTSGTPLSCSVACDDGNLTWDMKQDLRTQMCRGIIQGSRNGNQVPIDISVTFRWIHLIQNTVLSTDPIVPYEMIMNEGGEFVSVSTSHEYALKWEFTVGDPSTATNGEKIVFNYVARTSLKPAEGDEYNKIDFTGLDFESKPTITRVVA